MSDSDELPSSIENSVMTDKQADDVYMKIKISELAAKNKITQFKLENLQKPAKIDLANIHKVIYKKDANRILKLKNIDPNVQRCECCMLPIKGELFSLFENNDLLAELGSSYSLYFMLFKTLVIYLAISFFTACLPCLIANSIQGNSYQWKEKANTSYLTIGNYGNPWENSDNSSVPYWQVIVHLSSCLIFLLISPLIYKIIRKKAVELDLMNTTPSDFTVIVKGLPKKYSHEELEEFFVVNSTTPVNIVSIVSTYDITDFVKVTSKIIKWQNKLEKIKLEKKSHEGSGKKFRFLSCLKKNYEEEDCIEKIKNYQEAQQKISEEMNEGLLTSVAFITFRTEIQARSVARQWGMSRLTKFLKKVNNWFAKEKTSVFKNKLLTTEMAPEPSDVYWENLAVGYFAKMFRKLITYFVAALTIFVTFICLFFINQSEKNIYLNSNENNPLKSRMASIFSSLLVIGINIFLSILIKFYSKQEMHHTWGAFNLSVTNKLVIAMFLNTAVIPLIVNYDYQTSWFTTGGLCNDIFWIQVANAFVSPIIYFLNPLEIWKKLKKFYYIKKGIEKITQEKANQLFVGPEVDLSSRYANLIKSTLVSLFYSPLVPIGVIITVFGICFEALIFKFMLIRKHSRSRKIGNTLALESSKWIRRIPSVYSLGALIFYYFYIPDAQTPLIVFFSLFCIYSIFHIESWIDSKFQDKSLEILTKIYKENNKITEFYENYANFLTVKHI